MGEFFPVGCSNGSGYGDGDLLGGYGDGYGCGYGCGYINGYGLEFNYVDGQNQGSGYGGSRDSRYCFDSYGFVETINVNKRRRP